MRLLDTSSYELTEFVGEDIPPYAILSHTWGEGEVLFHDIQNRTAQSKKGFKKLVGCCAKAVDDGFKWVWIDTCCIDKTSSAELSEAINSMYQWYRDSVICYAYLEDVTEVIPTPNTLSKQFTESRWFIRGWTLQELIAPRVVEFYTSDWAEIGTKSSLVAQIMDVTGIPTRVLRGESVLMCNVAQRMSWASKRQTTRREDMAYCLMGLFQINMPLLYGEGDKAFVRLQEQILRQEEDYSVLAWTLQEDRPRDLTGCLASSPSQFANFVPEDIFEPARLVSSGSEIALYQLMHSKSYERYQSLDEGLGVRVPPSPPELTARGIRITLPLRRARSPNDPDMASIYREADDRLVCVLLRSTERGGAPVVARALSSWLVSVHRSLWPEFELTEVFLFPYVKEHESWLWNLHRLDMIRDRTPLSARLELKLATGYNAYIIKRVRGKYLSGRYNLAGAEVYKKIR